MQSFKFIIFFLAVTAFALFAASCGGSQASTANTSNANVAPTIIDVTTAQAIVRDIPAYFEATGNLASDAQTDVAPTVGGKIVQVNFDVGSYVNRGDVLVRLDDRDARIRLEQAEAQAAQARSAVQQAQAQVEAARANVRQTQARLGITEGSQFDIETFRRFAHLKYSSN
jgi:multidrug efflux pump subunit AcrA (membrane-fusion protein)